MAGDQGREGTRVAEGRVPRWEGSGWTDGVEKGCQERAWRLGGCGKRGGKRREKRCEVVKVSSHPKKITSKSNCPLHYRKQKVSTSQRPPSPSTSARSSHWTTWAPHRPPRQRTSLSLQQRRGAEVRTQRKLASRDSRTSTKLHLRCSTPCGNAGRI